MKLPTAICLMLVMLHYGQNRQPVLDSCQKCSIARKTYTFLVSGEFGLRNGCYCRTTSEATVLAELACADVSLPTLAMVDGSLIYWFLEQLPIEARDRLLHPPDSRRMEPATGLWHSANGYLSASCSGEAQLLRLQACPHEVPDCMTYCP